MLDLGELSRLKQSLEIINGAESNIESNAKSPTHTQNNNEKDIKDKIDIIVQDFANKLYDAIKNG